MEYLMLRHDVERWFSTCQVSRLQAGYGRELNDHNVNVADCNECVLPLPSWRSCTGASADRSGKPPGRPLGTGKLPSPEKTTQTINGWKHVLCKRVFAKVLSCLSD